MENKIAALKEGIKTLKKLQVRMLAAPDQQISQNDTDSRAMATIGHGKATAGYNVQAAVNTTHPLIVAHEATNVGNDRAQLANMSKQAKDAMGIEELTVSTDRGYFSGPEILACEQAGITSYVPKTLAGTNLAKGHFGKREFIYIAKDDEYECPAGERLI